MMGPAPMRHITLVDSLRVRIAERMSEFMTEPSQRHGITAVVTIVLIAIVATGCTGASHRTSSSSTRQRDVSSSPGSKVPNPFVVTDRFRPSSLGLTDPLGMAIAPDGNLYVTDKSQSVVVVSPTGKVLRRWGKPGTGPGDFEFHDSAQIAVGPDGRVYVSDNGNYRVQLFSPTGTYISQFGSQGSGKGQFLSPHDLAVDQAGDVYVADDPAETVSKFSPTGRFQWQIGGFTSEDPDLQGHEHVADVDTHGQLVMANDDKGKVLYIDASGHKVDAFDTHKDACDVTVDGGGDTFVYYCDGPGLPVGSHDVEVFDRTHRLIGAWYGNSLFHNAPRFGPNGEVFALGTDGTILKLRVALP
jgi:streptogramin lyase